MTAVEVLAHLKQIRKAGPSAWMAACPAHPDPRASLSVKQTGDKLLVYCHAGCDAKAVVEAVGLSMRDLFVNENGSNGAAPAAKRPARPLRLAEFAAAKKLPVELLLAHGVEEVQGGLLFTYRDSDGQPAPRGHLRPTLVDPEWRWLGKSGDPIIAYGLDQRGGPFDARDWALVVEGESDVLTAHAHDIIALGVPSAGMSRVLRKRDIEWLARLYIVREPDKGGETLVTGVRLRLAEIEWPGQAFVVTLPVKDVSELHLTAGPAFDEKLKAAMDAALPLDDAKLKQAIMPEAAEAAPARRAVSLRVEVDKLLDAIKSGEVPQALPTPFPSVNHFLSGGLFPGDFVIVGGKTSAGKSAFATECARKASTLGGVLIDSHEMSNEAVTRRLIAQTVRIPVMVLKSRRPGQLAAYQHQLAEAVQVGNMPIQLLDKAASVLDVEREIRLWQGPELKLVICDYLQLMAGPGKDRRLQIEAISRGLKALAVRYSIAVMALSSLSRLEKGAKDRRPVLQDLRESGELEHDADVVLFVRRPEEKGPEAEVVIAKQRDGMTGICHLRFDAEFVSFRELDTVHGQNGTGPGADEEGVV